MTRHTWRNANLIRVPPLHLQLESSNLLLEGRRWMSITHVANPASRLLDIPTRYVIARVTKFRDIAATDVGNKLLGFADFTGLKIQVGSVGDDPLAVAQRQPTFRVADPTIHHPPVQRPDVPPRNLFPPPSERRSPFQSHRLLEPIARNRPAWMTQASQWTRRSISTVSSRIFDPPPSVV